MKIITVDEFRKLLRNNKEVDFTFKKKDGMLREAKRTTEISILENNYAVPSGTGNVTPIDIVKFFDLDKLEWRSARIESITSINGEDVSLIL